ncbi:MAG: DUF72 domain-containing protein [Candidatus Saccharibacteria bacterium]
MKTFVGTSGWTYKHWNRRFFPDDLPKEQWLNFLSRRFPTVEVNTTFYHMARRTTFEKWKGEVGGGFKFALKMYRLFTHFKKLNLDKEDEETLSGYLRNASVLGRKLGPILIQFPPSFSVELEKLGRFLSLIREQEKELGQRFKLAVEVRHKSWFKEEVYDFFRDRRIAFVITNSPAWPSKVIRTADFVYMRFHGRTKLFASNYTDAELKEWAETLKGLKAEEMYVYFNNDANAFAADNALTLLSLLGGKGPSKPRK